MLPTPGRVYVLLTALALFSFTGLAQQRPGYVQAVASATVSVTPDQAQIQFAVVTTATTAQAASSQNATQVTAVLAALTGLLGPSANIQTLSYSLSPNYTYPQNGQPVLTGYTASNTVQVIVTDLSVIGKLIDTGIQAGANRVQGLSFGLQNDMPSRQQALKMATVQAKSNADAMASGLGMTTGAVLSITEGSVVAPTPLNLAAATPSATTPVETGVVNVSATVTLQIAISQ
jgi:uncharacterized protein YggE